MSLGKALDHGIMLQETARIAEIQAGYKVDGRTYGNYLSNESWKAFEADMKANHPKAYEQYALGGGKEMEERKSGKYIYPPKMASFGSSSRMIYNLMKSNPDFLYEMKLPTTIGGIANLDGFLETKEKCLFVEAKCREPYSQQKGEVAEKYRELYEYLTRSENNNLTCEILGVTAGKMQVRFYIGQNERTCFDIKQMICHLLGIATACLQGRYNKNTQFIYLLYNPTELAIEKEIHKKEILQIYDQECAECAEVDFSGLFF